MERDRGPGPAAGIGDPQLVERYIVQCFPQFVHLQVKGRPLRHAVLHCFCERAVGREIVNRPADPMKRSVKSGNDLVRQFAGLRGRVANRELGERFSQRFPPRVQALNYLLRRTRLKVHRHAVGVNIGEELSRPAKHVGSDVSPSGQVQSQSFLCAFPRICAALLRNGPPFGLTSPLAEETGHDSTAQSSGEGEHSRDSLIREGEFWSDLKSTLIDAL